MVCWKPTHLRADSLVQVVVISHRSRKIVGLSKHDLCKSFTNINRLLSMLHPPRDPRGQGLSNLQSGGHCHRQGTTPAKRRSEKASPKAGDVAKVRGPPYLTAS